jgi:hypothetical protein
MLIPPENAASVLSEFHIFSHTEIHYDSREEGVRRSGKDTSSGVQNQEFRMRQRVNAISDYFLSVFSHENEDAPATDLHYLMYREGRDTWKQIIQRNNEKQPLNKLREETSLHNATEEIHIPMF